MYYQFFNFSEPPFSIAPNPRFLYMSPRHQEALAHLLFGISEGGGFIALTGEVGTGKTTLCRSLLEQLPKNVEAALLLNPRLNSIELLASLCDELRITYPAATKSLKVLVDALNDHLLTSHANGHRAVVIIDEAQNLTYGVLEQIRLLTNLETAQTKLLQIILVGQPELNGLLNQENLRQLSQRITARYHLGALNQSETKAYIDHRLHVSGCEDRLFSNRSIRLIHRRSGGIPRLINVICDRALLGAYTQGSTKVTPTFIRKASDEVLPVQRQRPGYLSIAAVSVILTAIASYFFHSSNFYQNDILGEKLLAQQKPVIEQGVTTPKQLPNKLTLATPVVKPSGQIKVHFIDYIQDPSLTMANAFNRLFALWHVDTSDSHGIFCDDAIKQGLSCLAQQGYWSLIRRLNRPAILEFPLSAENKRYVTLVDIKDDQAVLSLNGERVTFPIPEVLPYWNGFFLLLWKPKYPDAMLLAPGNTHPSVGWLRNILNQETGARSNPKNGNYFDQVLKKKVMEFQNQSGLKPDGFAGPQTLIILNNQRRKPGIPTLNNPTVDSDS